MIKRNNKGFTLLELIISIFIITTVIFIGYRVINKSTMYIKNQSNIHKGQLTVNDMNEYLTKDLEKARDVLLFINDNTEQEDSLSNIDLKFQSIIDSNLSKYKYIISLDSTSNIISYEIDLVYKNNQYRYSVTRIDNSNTRIKFIDSEILSDIDNVPFSIKGDNPYEVNIQYTGKDYKVVKHKFDIMSRYSIIHSSESIPSIPPDKVPDNIPEGVKPSYPGDIDINDSVGIGYWMMDTEIYVKGEHEGDLYTWIDGTGEYGEQRTSDNGQFYITGENSSGASAKANAYMRDSLNKSDRITIEKNSENAKNIEKLKIYLSPYTTLEEVKVIVGTKGNNTFKSIKGLDSVQNGRITLNGGHNGKWYEVEFTKPNSGMVNFGVYGKLSIDESERSSGYAFIVYGAKSNEEGGTSGGVNGGDSSSGGSTSELDGDIIFEFTRNDKGGQNSNESYLQTAVKVKDKNDEYVTGDPHESKNVGRNKFSNFRLHFYMTSDGINFNLDTGDNPSVKNDELCKDLSRVKELSIKLDQDVKIKKDSCNQCTVDQISQIEYKIKPSSENFTLYFDIPDYDTDKIDEFNFKISITLIEYK